MQIRRIVLLPDCRKVYYCSHNDILQLIKELETFSAMVEIHMEPLEK